MLLTLSEAATRLGKSVRQIRYLIQTERLPATKREGRWVVDDAALTALAGSAIADARQRTDAMFTRVVAEAAGPKSTTGVASSPPGGPDRRRFSVADLRAFALARPVHDAVLGAFGAEHPAMAHLRCMLEQLALGCHRYDWSEKAAAYRSARDAASRATLALMLTDARERAVADAQVEALEQQVIGAIGGLVRRVDRKRAGR